MLNNKKYTKPIFRSIVLVLASLFLGLSSCVQPVDAASIGQYFSNNVSGCYIGSGQKLDNLGTLSGTSFDGNHGRDFGNAQLYKNEFIDFVEHRINWISRKYIILTMLGYQTAGRDVSAEISAEEEATWQARVNNPSLYMKIDNFSFSVNTALCNFGMGNVLTYDDSPRSAPSLIFYTEGTPGSRQGTNYYAIKLDCLNPVGTLLGLINTYDLSLGFNYPAVNSTVTSSGTVNLNWWIKNSGNITQPSNSNYPFAWRIFRKIYSTTNTKGSDGTLCQATTGLVSENKQWQYSGTGVSPGTYQWSASDSSTSYPAGYSICYGLSAMPRSSTDSGSVWAYTQVNIVNPQTFSLIPTIDATTGGQPEPGSQVTLKSIVNNSGSNASSNTSWSITASDGSIPGASGVYDFQTGPTYNWPGVPTAATIPSNATIGSQICYTLSVSPKANNDSSAATSTSCVTVGKKPKVQIWGGDLWAHGFVNTSVSSIASRVYGSWSEYAVLVSGNNTGFGSGAARYGGTTDNCAVRLTLNNANDASATCNGNASNITGYNSAKIGDMVANFNFEGAPSLSGSVSANSLSSGNYVASGDITLNQSLNLNKGKSVVIKVNGKVTINGNQTYTNNGYNSISDIPQLVIIANEIIINDDVTQVDGWLIAKGGSIKTCSKEARSINECNKSLTINGPVVADKLYLYRTAGAEPGSLDEPAEKFNLRADALLWAYNYASTNRPIKTVYNTELPPRL